MTYDYTCPTCQHVHTLRSSVLYRDAQSCPDCAGKLRRLFSPGITIMIPDVFTREPIRDDVVDRTDPTFVPSPSRREI